MTFQRPYETTITPVETRQFHLSFVERNEKGGLERHHITVDLPIMGTLEQREREFIELDASKRPDRVGWSATLAILIGKQEGIDEYQAFLAITNDKSCKLDENEQARLRIKYAQNIAEAYHRIRELDKFKKRAEVTAILIGRGGLTDWTVERTAALPIEQFEPLQVFATCEALGEPQAPAEIDKAEFVESLKKPPETPESQSESSPTGTQSSGSSDSSGQTTPASSRKTSRGSRSRSSTKRSPKDSNSDAPISTP